MPNIGKDDHPKLWSLIFVLIIALTFCCFVMGQGLNSVYFVKSVFRV